MVHWGKRILRYSKARSRDWRHSSSGRVLAKQAQNPEFKPQYQQTNKQRLGVLANACNPNTCGRRISSPPGLHIETLLFKKSFMLFLHLLTRVYVIWATFPLTHTLLLKNKK
jgi:hypothetical protein